MVIGLSFRSLSPRVYPGLAVLLAITLAGCGGGGEGGGTTTSTATQVVRAPGLSFSAPAGWPVKRVPTSVQAGPAQAGGPVVVVYSLRTVKPYRAAMWSAVSAELDRKARALAQKLGGHLTATSTGTVAGSRARRYLFAYGARRARIAFLFRDRREYELYCSWKTADGEPEACRLLLSSFRLA